MSYIRTLAAAAAAAAIIFSGVSPAAAAQTTAEPISGGGEVDSSVLMFEAGPEAASKTTLHVSQECIEENTVDSASTRVSASDLQEFCTVEVTAETSEAVLVTEQEAEQIAAEQNMSPAEAYQFVTSAARATIYSKDWTVSAVGALNAYKEVMTGRAYYDYAHSWIGTRNGYTGWVVCQAAGSYAVGVVITNTSCTHWKNGVNAMARDTFKVSAVVANGPVARTWELSALIRANGIVQVTVA